MKKKKYNNFFRYYNYNTILSRRLLYFEKPGRKRYEKNIGGTKTSD